MTHTTLTVAAILLVALAGCQCQPRRMMLNGDEIGTEIVGGNKVDIKDYPYQIAMLSNGRLICGGSIISSNWVLTASHCVYSSRVSSTSVRAGSTYNDRGGQVVMAKSLSMHPNFDMSSMQNDVALIELESALTLDDVNTRAVSLVPVGNARSASEELIVSGWGTLYSGAYSLPSHLYAVTVPVVPHSQCASAYRRYNMDVDDSMFCAGKGGKDSCQGDSGGPIVDSQKRQVGVVSWGAGCAQSGFPGVYADLTNSVSRNWIVKTANLQE